MAIRSWGSGERGDCRATKTIHRDYENAQHGRSQAIEPAAHDGGGAEVSVGEGKGEHNAQAGQHETESCQHPAPPAPTGMPQKRAELHEPSPR
jgi:hypothetical protein